MANTVIRLKKSSVSGRSPTALEWGELAINYTDGKLFYKDDANVIQRISGGANSFMYMNVAGTMLVAGVLADVLTINSGNNISMNVDAVTNRYTISANLNPAYIYASDIVNSALTFANNTFLRKDGGTITGDLTVTGNTEVNAIVARGTYGTAGQVLTSNGTSVYWASFAGGGTDSYEVVRSNTALAGAGKYMVDTANGTIYITLPDVVGTGEYVSLVDMLGDKTVNSAIIRCNTSTINGSSDDFYFDVPNVKVELIYTGTTWKVFA